MLRFKFGPDMAFIILFILLIICIVIPMPAYLIDVLISLNLCATILILVISLNISSAVELPSFPSILLITTLFRLSLNVASTRAILTEGDAGRVIFAFGNFVIQGNYFAGAVVFLIITIIQIIVVTKGAERVAEVSARFTLDAMPGKQMSIDAELRSGHISPEEAIRRRSNLAVESQFFGSMDGAMKFVKGDAIAGILISIINVVGGISTGTIMKNLSISDAVSRYTILSIGDGLVSQIPSLIISISAGIIITRISTVKKAGLGKEIYLNLTRKPLMILVVSIVALIFAILPHIPFIPFFLIASAFFLAYRRLNNSMKDNEVDDSSRYAINSANSNTLENALSEPQVSVLVEPISLIVSNGLINEPSIISAETIVRDLISQVRKDLITEIGYRLPGVKVVKTDEDEITIGLKLFGVRVSKMGLKSNPSFVKIDKYAEDVILELYDGTYIRYANENDSPEKIIDIREFIIEFIKTQINKNIRDMFGIQETSEIVEEISSRYPALIKETVPRSINLNLLSEVLKNLLAEGVSIRNIKGILETLQKYVPFEKNPNILTEFVRVSLSRQICQTLSRNRAISVTVVSPEINKIILDSLADVQGESVLAINPQDAKRIIDRIKEAKLNSKGQMNLLTDFEQRRFLRKIIEYEMPFVHVLSFKEICPEIKVDINGTINL